MWTGIAVQVCACICEAMTVRTMQCQGGTGVDPQHTERFRHSAAGVGGGAIYVPMFNIFIGFGG